MSEQFSILIDSRSRFETGIPGGVWLSMPTTKEQLHAAMESVGITADNPKDFFINGIANTEEIPFDVPLSVIQNASIDELNYLGKVLEMQRGEDRDKFAAAVTLGEYAGSIKDLINLAQNLDCYWLYPAVQNEEDYGYYLIDEVDELELPEEVKKYFQYEEYGRDAAINDGGRFTEQGYIYNNKNTFTEWYKGQESDIPREYRVMSFPQPPHRTEPTAYMDAAAPGIMAQAQKAQTQETQEQPQNGQTQEPRPVTPIALTSEKPAEKLKEITDRLEQGIKELFDSERYKEYLRVMSKFHNYSFNNTLLIAMQKPDASHIAGFSAWKNNFGRNVMKGQKGIKIIAPSPFKIKQEMEKIDPHTQKPVIGKDGKPVTEEMEITIPAFKVVSVFDVSQTEGKELPTISVDMLTGDVDRYKDFFAALEKTSPVPIAFENIEGGAHGYYHLEDKRIAIQEDMSELQTLKTAIHEIAHAKLHDIDLKAPKDTQKQIDSRTREVEAESVAYTVCQHYGLDTSDYSFGYVAGWSSGRELAELKGSLETIRGAAAEIINSIDEHIAELQKLQDKEQTAAPEQPEKENPEKENTAGKKKPEQEAAAQGKSGAKENNDAPEKAAFTHETIYRVRKNPYSDSRENSYLLQAYVTQESGRAKMGDVLYTGTPEKCRALMKQLKSGELTEGQVKELYAKSQEQPEHARITAASRSRYEGMVALYDMDDKVYIGKSENYDNKGHYDNSDNSLLYVSDLQQAFTFLSSEGCVLTQDEALKQGVYTQEDYGEFSRIQDALSQAGLTPEKEFYFADKPFSPHGDTKELEAAPGNLPDPTISTEDMKQYGYSWDGMLPLQEAAALNLFEKEDMQIFRLYGDGSENIVNSADDIKNHADKGGILGVHKEDWDALREYREMKQELAESAPEKEALLLYGKEDTFGIYQIKDGGETRDLRFEPYDRLQAAGNVVDKANYELVYTAPLAPDTSLEDIYTRFNTDHPKDFKGHSLSVSDIVVLHQDGQNAAHYVDSFGYRDVPEFLQPQNHLKHIEDTVEQNDNSFDGIINNTPTPTVDELEAKAAAGEQISLAALAGAIKADKERAKEAKPEKKPSIRAQLKADKEKAQKKAAKSKSQDLERS